MKRSGFRDAASLALCLLACFVPALIGSRARPGLWYDSLVKPALTPPGVVFPVVWTLLYLSMGVAAWLVWRRREQGRPVGVALGVFAVQLALNAAWSPVFFGMQRPGAALMVLAVLWAAVLGSVILFWRVRRLAGAMLLPYLAWVSFAGYLNAAIWWLNR